jgi:tetratricopeptide (TPR) repeat protein
MSHRFDVEKIVQAIPKVPAQIGQVTAFIATLVGFIRLWQQGPEIVSIIMVVLGVSILCLLLAYVAFSRVPPLIVGGSEKWRFSRWRPYALLGLIVVPLLAVASLTLSLIRAHSEAASARAPTAEVQATLTQAVAAAQPVSTVAAPTATQTALPTASPTATKRPTPANAYTVLLADLDGPEPGKHRVTEAIQGQLLRALPEDSTVVMRLGRPINQALGQDDALAEGNKHKAALVVWGRYNVEIDRISILVHVSMVGRPEQRLVQTESAGQLRALVVAEPTTVSLPLALAADMPEVGFLSVGLWRYQSARWEDAITALDKLLAQTLAKQPLPEYGALVTLRGIARLRAGHVDQAVADLSRAVEISPDLVEARINRGNGYYLQGNYDRAIADYDQAIKTSTHDARAYANRGLATYDSGDNELGMVDYDQAVEFAPKLAAAHYNRGNAYWDDDDLEAAIGDYDQAIAADSTFAEAWYMRGVMRRHSDQGALALTDLNQAIALRPNMVEAYNERGLLYEDMENLIRAAEDFDKALALRPDYMPATVNRGNMYYERDDWDRALAYYDRAIKLAPDTAEAHHNRGYALFKLAKYELALEAAQSAIELEPKDPSTWVLVGRTRHAMGQYAEAVKNYDEAVSLDKADAEVYYYRALSYRELEREELAIADLQLCIKLEPEPELHRQALEALTELGAR